MPRDTRLGELMWMWQNPLLYLRSRLLIFGQTKFMSWIELSKLVRSWSVRWLMFGNITPARSFEKWKTTRGIITKKYFI
jgi:hypothetical protein